MRRFLVFGSLCVLFSACSGDEPWRPDVDIPRTDVYVSNFSAERILEVYVRMEGVTVWGDNWLSAPISGGNLYTWLGDFPSGTYDFRMVGEFTTQAVMGLACVGESVGVGFQAPPATGRESGAPAVQTSASPKNRDRAS